MSGTVTECGVNPAVETPAEVVDHGVGVASAESGIELGALVTDTFAGGVFEEPDVRRSAGDDAVFVKAEAGDEFELISKDVLFIHHAVAVGVLQPGNTILRVAVELAGVERSCIFPGIGVLLATTIGILRCLADPHAAFLVPIHVHDFVHEWLGRDERDVKLGVHFEFLRSLLRARRTTFDIAEIIAKFFGLAEFVSVGALASPCDAA